MAENRENHSTEKPGDSDTSSDSKLKDRKAELDSDDILLVEDSKDKVLLDKDGIFDGTELSQDEEQPSREESEKVEELKKEGTEDKETGGSILTALFSKFKKLPWLKYSAIIGGTVVLFFSIWFVISFFLFSTTGEDEAKKNLTQDVKPEKVPDTVKYIDLDTFVIPIEDTQKGKVFLKTKILLGFTDISEDEIKIETKKIRLAIYNLLSQKKAQDILNDRKKERIKAELQNVINNVFEKNVITSIYFSDILLV